MGLLQRIMLIVPYAKQAIQDISGSIYIPRGINTPALDQSISWDFEPTTFRVSLAS